MVRMAGMSVSRISHVMFPLSACAFTLAASGGPSSRTRMPVAASNGLNITSRMALVREPPQLAITISPLSARALFAWKKGPSAASELAPPRRTLRREIGCFLDMEVLRFDNGLMQSMAGGQDWGLLRRPADANFATKLLPEEVAAIWQLGRQHDGSSQPQHNAGHVHNINEILNLRWQATVRWVGRRHRQLFRAQEQYCCGPLGHQACSPQGGTIVGAQDYFAVHIVF